MPRIIRPELLKQMRRQGRIPTKEAAARAFVSDSTIRHWVHTKEVDAVYYNHTWWVSIESLKARALPEPNK